MVRCLPAVLCACGTGAPVPGATGLPGTPYGALPERELVRECDPVIRPASARSAYDVGEVDPHAEVYGTRAPTPFHVHLGWPSSDPSTGISFLWHTDVETLATRVELTPDGGPTEVYDGASYVVERRIHEVRLCDGLRPGTTYTYRVGGPGHWSPTYRFRTPEAPGEAADFRAVLFGDSRGSYEVWGDVLAQADAHDPDFFVFTGDMVNSGTNQGEWDAWFAAAGAILAEKVLVPAHGNAEWLAVNYFAQFALPNNEEWFSIRYGDLHLVSLNDTPRQPDDFEAQADYLRAAFDEHGDAAWRVVAHHRPTWTSNTTHPPYAPAVDAWVPVFDAYDVDLAVNGHNHFYERSVPIRAGQAAAPGEGTVYLVTGGAGAPLYTGYQDAWFRDAVATTEHYIVADFGPAGIDAVVYDLAGNVLDTWSIPR